MCDLPYHEMIFMFVERTGRDFEFRHCVFVPQLMNSDDGNRRQMQSQKEMCCFSKISCGGRKKKGKIPETGCSVLHELKAGGDLIVLPLEKPDKKYIYII